MSTNEYSPLRNTVFVIRQAMRNDRLYLPSSLLYACLRGFLSAVLLYIPKWILDALLSNNSQSMGYIAFLLSVFAAAGIAYFFCEMLASDAYARAIKLRFKLVEKHQLRCLTTDYTNIEDPKFEDEVFSSYRCVNNNTSGFEGVLHRLYMWPSALASIAVCAWALIESGPLLIIPALIVSCVDMLIFAYFSDKKTEERPELNAAQRQSRFVGNMMRSREMALDMRLPIVKAFMWTRYDGIREQLSGYLRREQSFALNGEFFVSVADALKTAAVYVYLIIKTCAGAMTVATLSLCIGAVEDFTASVSVILRDLRFIREQSYDITQFRRFTEEQDDKAASAEGVQLASIDEIRFKHVSYKYPNAHACALTDVSVTFRRGTKTAITGENGSGKTTFVKLLLGLLEPTSGHIYVNGIDLSDIDKATYRRLIGSVFQDYHMLAFSVRENVSLAEDNADDARICDALKRVNMLAKVNDLPNGLNTPITRRVSLDGVELSGGESQRVAIARALFAEPDMFVLDEPSASLDPLAEERMYQMFADEMDGATVIMVSHRLTCSTICDTVLHFGHGTIVESGTHSELIAKGGAYAESFNAQAAFYQSTQGVGA